MTIHLPPDVEQSLIAAVQSGLFPSLDAALTRAARLLLERIGQESAGAVRKPLTIEEFNRQLLAEGRISRLPETAADFDDPEDQPVTIEGEPLSETIIRERR